MYCDLNEFAFIIMAVITGLMIWKFGSSILKGIWKLMIKSGAKVLRAELKQIEIEKLVEKAEKEL